MQFYAKKSNRKKAETFFDKINGLKCITFYFLQVIYKDVEFTDKITNIKLNKLTDFEIR